MRCCALLRGICVLEDACLPALTGILERQNWETWLVSRYILLRGDDAVSEIKGDHVKNTRTLNTRLGLGSEYVPDWEGDAQKLIIGQLTEKLEPMLVKAGDTDGTALVKGYDPIYRAQSQYAVHAGLSTLGLYVRLGEESWSVEPNPPAPFDDIGQISLFCTLNLALHVFNRFGIATDAVEAVSQAVLDEFNTNENPEGVLSRPE